MSLHKSLLQGTGRFESGSIATKAKLLTGGDALPEEEGCCLDFGRTVTRGFGGFKSGCVALMSDKLTNLLTASTDVEDAEDMVVEMDREDLSAL